MAKILVVDDDEMFRDIYEDLLEDEGHDVLLAENGALGIESALAHMPDLIVMDLNMPEMDGFEAIRRLKANPATNSIPILAATAENATTSSEEISAAGGDGYLSKPIDSDMLIAGINDLLS
jgi:CheY-like chemotaxis protein